MKLSKHNLTAISILFYLTQLKSIKVAIRDSMTEEVPIEDFHTIVVLFDIFDFWVRSYILR